MGWSPSELAGSVQWCLDSNFDVMAKHLLIPCWIWISLLSQSLAGILRHRVSGCCFVDGSFSKEKVHDCESSRCYRSTRSGLVDIIFGSFSWHWMEQKNRNRSYPTSRSTATWSRLDRSGGVVNAGMQSPMVNTQLKKWKYCSHDSEKWVDLVSTRTVWVKRKPRNGPLLQDIDRALRGLKAPRKSDTNLTNIRDSCRKSPHNSEKVLCSKTSISSKMGLMTQ